MPPKKRTLGIGPKRPAGQPRKKVPEVVESEDEDVELGAGAPVAAADPPEVLPEPEEEVPDGKPRKNKNVILNEAQELELGEWLRQHPEIYAKGLRGYKDVSKKQRLWEEKAV